MRITTIFIFLLVLLVGCSDTSPVISENSGQSETNETTNKPNQNQDQSTIERQNTKGKQMSVHFIDVGQGDSILVISPNGKTMLIDGGTRGAGKDVVSHLRSQNIKQLDYVVATHPDADHIGGLISVLNSISIKNFIDSGKVHTSETFEEMLTLIHTKNIPYTVPKTGNQILLDKEIQIDVLHADEQASDNNEASIVLKLTYGDVSFLLTGDAGVKIEEQMMRTQDVSATILKAGHHGSNTSSSSSFIKEVNPESTILSYGQDNSYGHPHYEVVENLRHVKSKIYGTAESGTIVVETNGKTYDILAKEWTGIGATSSIVPPKVNQKTSSEVVITSKDLKAETVGIKNTGTQSVNLKGWKLLSVEGDQTFNFPNISIKPGEMIYVTSGPDAMEGNGYLKWTGQSIWLNSGDPAQLMNSKGEIVSELQ